METQTQTQISNIEQINNKYLKQIKKSRHELKYNRKEFWKKNMVNFRNNLKTLVSFFPFPEGWRVNIVASYFLLDKEGISMPYDNDVWSFADIVGATKNQGHDLVVFFNRTDLEFLTAPALVPIVVHEMKHVEQAAKDPKKYIEEGVDDELNREFEKEAETEVRKYSDEFRMQNVLEKIMYCYDKKSWKGAKKMAQYLYEEAENSFGGGYDQQMRKEEYEIFLKAEEERDIDIFLDFFVESIGTVSIVKESPKEAVK
jgi:hypothetical protein